MRPRSRKDGANPELKEAELREALARAGWRFTQQRHAVYAYLRSVPHHPTADQVHEAVRRRIPHVSLATIYKALEALVDAGLATKLADESGPARFDYRCDPHYHLRCLKTGQVLDLPTPYDASLPNRIDPELLESLRRQGFEVTGHRLELVGRFV